jgi:hypothetical protein
MSWLDDDSIYGIFNKPNHKGPGTHFDEDKAHVSSKPIPASSGAEKEDILMTDFMPSAAEVKKESDELFAEIGNQGDHAGNTAADEGDEDDDDAPARPAGGRGGKRGGAGRKADPPEVKAAKAAARAETAAEAKVIEAAKIAAIRANLAAAIETPAASEGGGAAAAAPAAAPVRKYSAGVGPRASRSRGGSRRGSLEDTEALAAAAAAAAAPKTFASKVKATFESFDLPEDTTKHNMDLELSKRANTIEMLKPRAAALGIDFPASITKKDLVLKILERIYG